MDDLEEPNSYNWVLRNMQLSIGELYYIIYRENKKGLEDIVDSILGLLIDHNTKPKEIACYTALLYNLAYVSYRGYDGIFISSSKRDFSAIHILLGTPHRTKIYFDGTQRFLEKMENLGYIERFLGGYKSKDFKVRGFSTFTDKLKQEIKENYKLKVKPMKDLIRLKNRKTKEFKVFKLDNSLREVNSFIEQYNMMMDEHIVELNGRSIDSELYRMFIDSFLSYGRMHNRVQLLTREDREELTIDEYETKEVDIQASHLTILYAQRGIDISDIDPYDPQVLLDIVPPEFNFNSKVRLTRKDIKHFIMRLINCKSRRSALDSLTSEPDLVKKFGREHKDYNMILDTLLERHHEVSDAFFKDMGMHLMYEESQIMLAVLQNCIEKGLPVIPVHDSIVCREQDVLEVEDMIHRAFHEKWTVNCKTKIK